MPTIGMPDTTNVRPLNDSLASAYGIPLEEAHDRFAIGRLFGLRSRIVHDGFMMPIYGQLLQYIEAVYIDVLHQHLGLPCAKKAEKVASDPAFNWRRTCRNEERELLSLNLCSKNTSATPTTS